MSELYTKLISNVIFPLQERLKDHNTVGTNAMVTSRAH
jgi:hypothetical protein